MRALAGNAVMSGGVDCGSLLTINIRRAVRRPSMKKPTDGEDVSDNPDDDDDDGEGDDCDDDDDASLAMPKDANEALLMGLDLEAIIRDARLIPHERIATFASMRSEVMHEIRFPEKYVGTPMSSLPALTNIIKGFRRGEMTVLTGPTGSGKVCAGIPVLSLLCVHFGQPIVY